MEVQGDEEFLTEGEAPNSRQSISMLKYNLKEKNGGGWCFDIDDYY